MAVQRDKVIANAEKLVAKGKIEPAIKEYERLLEDNPNDVNTLNRIGDLWVRINRNEEAVKVFVKIADHYSRDGFFLKAIAIFKKINKLDPSKLDIYAKLADLYAKQGLAMEAKSQYQVLADYYLKHGEPGNALGIYRKISELDPQSINVHVKLADLYSQNNQTAEALKEYDRVGRMLLKRGMLDEAVQVFRKALKIDPKNTELVDSLVTALLEAKDFENAKQIVDAALETNKDNPRLLAMQGRIQLGRGDVAGARATLERAIAADPNESSVREVLADLYLKHNEADRALDMIAPLAEKALARGERGAAIEMLNRIIRVESGHAPTLERMVAIYTRLNEETNVLAAMNSLAEAHIARMRFDEASKVLEKLIQREPQNAQHRNKLQFVRSQMGGLDTMPARGGGRTSDLPPMEIEEPAPSFDMTEEVGGEFSLDLDSSSPLDLDLSLDTGPVAAMPRPSSYAPQHLKPAVEIVADDLASGLGGGDDLDFITEHLTEAEVFAKYGLAEKAAEHLRAVLERAPKNLTAHERLFRILLEEGDNDAARAAAQAYVTVLEERGDPIAVGAVKNEFLSRGQTFDVAPPARVAPPAPAYVPPAPKPAPPPEPALTLDDFAGDSEGEISFDLEGPGSEIEFDLESPLPELGPELQPEPVAQFAAPEPEPEPELRLEPEPEPQIAAVEELPVAEEFSFDPGPMIEELPAAEEVVLLHETPADLFLPEPEPEPELLPEPELQPEELFSGSDLVDREPMPPLPDFEEPVGDFQFSSNDFELPGAELEAPVAEEPFFGVEALDALQELPLEQSPIQELPVEPEPVEELPALVEELAALVEELPLEELGEVDFYIEQELFDEARRKLETLAARFPGHAELEVRRDRVAAASAAASAPRPAVLSRAEIETELLSAIPDDDDDFAMPMAALTPAPEPPAMAASFVQEENLFADEDNFFDLAAELESELADEEEAISLSEEEQSLEEIFKEFKRGVEQQLDSEDYDTHYNLGIAYKEMGLIDEAIGEFQLASKDPKRAVECASMLGLCFLEKGMPQLAIKWYRKGLEMPEITEEEHVGLLYDLACAYQEVGDTDNAQKAFVEVYGLNSNYRDIVGRIKQLEDARK
jgi:pilus assembly protein FimV